MMYKALYRYFIQHNNLHVPGIGTFLLERTPAKGDFPNKLINPPAFSIALQQIGADSSAGIPNHSKQFFAWLAEILTVSDREAVMRFNDFAFELKKKLNSGSSVQWNGMGTLSKGLAGEIKFFPASKELIFEKAVPAIKLIRENAEHMIRVGEEEKTSVQMTEILSMEANSKRSNWWGWPLVAAILVIMFIGWYFSQYGMDVESTANHKKLAPLEAAATYRELK
jgi:hypothetical protein